MLYFKTITALLDELNQRGAPYCALRNYENIREEAEHDLDIFVSGNFFPVVDEIMPQISKKSGWQQMYKHSMHPAFSSYVLLGGAAGKPSLLHIDFFKSITWHGINLLDPADIIKNRILYSDSRYYIIHPADGAIQRLLQPLLGEGKIREKYKEFIFENSQSHKEQFTRNLSKIAGAGLANSLYADIQNKAFSRIEAKRARIGLAIILREILRNPRYLFILAKLTVKKITRMPSGLFLILIGPDGSGKGTLTKELLCSLRKVFIEVKAFHWRPGILPPLRKFFKPQPADEGIQKTPASVNRKKNNYIISFVRFAYYSLDFVLGYFFKILPVKIKGGCVIIERYYYDCLVDPLRYGFNLPRWILKAVSGFIPKPDLTIYLDNSAENIYARKKELPIEEIARQVEAFREIIPKLPNPGIIATDKSINEVVYAAVKIILDTYDRKLKKISQAEPQESLYLWKSELVAGHTALPSKKNCRWIIPVDLTFALAAWNLYCPHSFLGSLYKKIYKLFFRAGYLRWLAPLKAGLSSSDKSEKLKIRLQEVFKSSNFILAISTGTPIAFRKLTAIIIDNSYKTLGYVKIGESLPAINRIKQEAFILKRLKPQYLKGKITVSVPGCLYEGSLGDAYILVESAAPFEGKSAKCELNDDYAEVLNALYKNSAVRKKFIESDFYNNLLSGIEAYTVSFRDLLKAGLVYLKNHIGAAEIDFTLSHGDFAPWNMLWKGKEVFIFDWELASFDSPAGIDLMHFIFQAGFFLKHLRAEKILNLILNNRNSTFLKEKIELPLMDLNCLLLCYLLDMAVRQDSPELFRPEAIERRRLLKLLIA